MKPADATDWTPLTSASTTRPAPVRPTLSKQLTPQEAQHYTPREFLGGKDNWDPR